MNEVRIVPAVWLVLLLLAVLWGCANDRLAPQADTVDGDNGEEGTDGDTDAEGDATGEDGDSETEPDGDDNSDGDEESAPHWSQEIFTPGGRSRDDLSEWSLGFLDVAMGGGSGDGNPGIRWDTIRISLNMADLHRVDDTQISLLSQNPQVLSFSLKGYNETSLRLYFPAEPAIDAVSFSHDPALDLSGRLKQQSAPRREFRFQATGDNAVCESLLVDLDLGALILTPSGEDVFPFAAGDNGAWAIYFDVDALDGVIETHSSSLGCSITEESNPEYLGLVKAALLKAFAVLPGPWEDDPDAMRTRYEDENTRAASVETTPEWDCARCDDGNPCTADGCFGYLCVNVILHNSPCDDGDPCTRDDICDTAGTCAGTTYSCNGHGTCNGTDCDCDDAYTGPSCDSCNLNFQDNNGDGVCEMACSHPDTGCEAPRQCFDETGHVLCWCNPTLVSDSNPEITAMNLAIGGNIAYVADRYFGLRLIDISTPESPVLLGGAGLSGQAHAVAIDGHTAYLASWDAGLHVLDISDPLSPQRIGGYDSPGESVYVALHGHRAYLADKNAGLHILDIANPATPLLLGTYDTPGWAQWVDIVGEIAFVADRTGGLQILDVQNPALPIQIGAYPTDGLAYGVHVRGSVAFVADGSEGLLVLDVTDPTAPSLLSHLDTPGFAWMVTVESGIAYMADGEAGMHLVDVRNPTFPKSIGSFPAGSGGMVRSVTLVDKKAYLANDNGGLRILDLDSCE